MKFEAFSLLDRKTGAFGVPFFVNHQAAAVRLVMDAARDGQVLFARYPQDFEIVHIGGFDDQSGRFVEQTPTVLGTVASFMPVYGVPSALPPQLDLERDAAPVVARNGGEI